MNPENLRFLWCAYPLQVLPFILRNESDYLKIMSDELFSMEELKRFLDSSASDEQKLQLLSFVHDPIPTIGKRYSLPVKLCILQNNPKAEETPVYYHNYDTEDSEMRETVYTAALSARGKLRNCLCEAAEQDF